MSYFEIPRFYLIINDTERYVIKVKCNVSEEQFQVLGPILFQKKILSKSFTEYFVQDLPTAQPYSSDFISKLKFQTVSKFTLQHTPQFFYYITLNFI